MSITKHLPLRVSEQTPSRIDTAAGNSISISWSDSSAANPYWQAEVFAAYLAKVVNCHAALANFASDVLREVRDGHDLDGHQVEQMAVAAGLLKEVEYDPGVHSVPSWLESDIRPGDPYYEATDALRDAWRAK